MVLTITAALTVAASGCATPPSAPEPMTLRFADAGLLDLDLDEDRYRSLARSVARAYVQVTMVTPASPAGEREADPRSRVVNGASGIIVDTAGYVVTAAHIAQDPDLEARVTTFDGNRHRARVVQLDAGRDLALLKMVDGHSSFHAAQPARGVRPGQPVLALGTPGNRPGAVTMGRVVRGEVEKTVRYGDFGFDDAIELRMRVEPGYSGGPVFNADGLLVGMIAGFDLRTADDGRYVATGSAYVVPAADVMTFFRRRTGAEGNISATGRVLL